MTPYSNRRNRLQSDSQAVEYTSLTYRLYLKWSTFGKFGWLMTHRTVAGLYQIFGKFGWLMTHRTVGRIIPNLLTLVENTMGMETMEAVDKLYDSLYAAQAITRQPLYHILLWLLWIT
jgi:hypothetical protein